MTKEKVPKNAKVVTSTWLMKKKSNGTYHVRINASRFEQCDQDYYDRLSISANEAMVRIVIKMRVVVD